jgi:hypothetical protein
MSARPPLDPRVEELLLEEALGGLDEADRRELEAALGDQAAALRQEFALAAAAVDLAHLDPDAALPAALRNRVIDEAPGFLAAPPPPRLSVVPRRPDRLRLAGWLAAAACFLVALAAIVHRPGPPGPPRPSEARAQLIAAGKAIRVAWSTTADPGSQGASGDVIWSTTEQRGYMSFRGLPANNPAESQYQLWIFDQNQDERYPIDGGVFDVGPDGEVIVPVTAKIRVHEPTLFAITVEKPGGVVVSSRKRLVLAAKVPAG